MKFKWLPKPVLLLAFIQIYSNSFSQLGGQRLFTPIPPRLSVAKSITTNGGRVHALTRNPENPDQICSVHQFGGIWMSYDAGISWNWLRSLPELFVTDAEWVRNNRIYASVKANLNKINTGGLYRSDDGGVSWTHLPNSVISSPIRKYPTVYGISSPAGNPDMICIGTEVGLRISYDSGRSWTHHKLSGTINNRFIDSAKIYNVLAISRDTIVVGGNTGAYYTTNSGMNWTLINAETYTVSHNRIDHHPIRRHLFFLISDSRNLFCFNFQNRTTQRLNVDVAFASRWPFVRVSSSPNQPRDIVIWLSTGIHLHKATASQEADLANLPGPAGWINCNYPNGVTTPGTAVLHADQGDLLFNPAKNRPFMAGCDGGLFIATDDSGTRWRPAYHPDNGANSLLITCLTGTQYPEGSANTARYKMAFGTQDNGFFMNDSDLDDNWPFSARNEGHSTRALSRFPNSEAIRMTGKDPGISFLFSDRFTLNRNIAFPQYNGMNLNAAGVVTPVTNNTYIRLSPISDMEGGVFISRDADAANWSLAARHNSLYPASHVALLSRSGNSTTAFYAMRRGSSFDPCTEQGRIRIMRIPNILGSGTQNIGNANILELPNNGSLGWVVTEFDWHAVYGVHPSNADFIIAPDVCNQRVMFTVDGGANWQINTNLTNLVTNNGTMDLYRGIDYHQITGIYFDPYDNNHILIGTRDMGVLESRDRGTNWRAFYDLEEMKFITDIFFKQNNNWIISTYGHGLWRSQQLRIRYPYIPDICLTGVNCGRVIRIPDRRELVIPDEAWRDFTGFVIYDGILLNDRAIRKGSKNLRVSKNANVKFYNMSKEEEAQYQVNFGSRKSFIQWIKRLFNGGNTTFALAWDEKEKYLITTKKDIPLSNEFALMQTKNMLLGNYDFSEEFKKENGPALTNLPLGPLLVINQKGEDTETEKPTDSRNQISFKIYHYRAKTVELKEVMIDGTVYKPTMSKIQYNENEQAFEGVLELSELSSMESSKMYSLQLVTMDGQKLTATFRLGF